MEVDVEQLIDRDGPECVWCGRELWRRDLTLDHVVPRSRGGHMTQENALLACRSCNRRRGARPVDAYVRDRLRDGAEGYVDAVRRSLTRLACPPRGPPRRRPAPRPGGAPHPPAAAAGHRLSGVARRSRRSARAVSRRGSDAAGPP